MDTSTKLTEPTPAPTASSSAPASAHGGRWKRRLALFTQVVFFIWIGMFLVVIPWTPIWSQNTLIGHNAALHAFLDLGFVRGALSGLGLINVWIGIWEAVHYRED